MGKYIALREFRLTDCSRTLRAGEEVDLDSEYCKTSRALRAALNAGWIDHSKKVSENDPRLKLTPKVEKKVISIQPVVTDEDRQVKSAIDQMIPSPIKKNALSVEEATKQAMERAAMRLKRLQDKDTPTDGDLDLKNVLVDDVPASSINKKLEDRKKMRENADLNYRRAISAPKNLDSNDTNVNVAQTAQNDVSVAALTVPGSEESVSPMTSNPDSSEKPTTKSLTVKQEMAKRRRDMRIKGIPAKEK